MVLGTVKANAPSAKCAKFERLLSVRSGGNPGLSESEFRPQSTQIGLGAFALTVPLEVIRSDVAKTDRVASGEWPSPLL